MFKYLNALLITTALATVALGCSDDGRRHYPQPDPTGLPKGVFDQAKFDESVWDQ